MPAEARGARGSGPPALCSNDDRPALPADAFDPDPVKRGTVRASRMGRRRAIVLLLIHLVVFAHLLLLRFPRRRLRRCWPELLPAGGDRL